MRKTRIELDRPCVRPGVTFEERQGGRFCLSCQEMQHDLTNVTRKQALSLIEANGGRICGTFLAGPTGELHFRAEPPSRVGHAARGAVLALALAGCGSPDDGASSVVNSAAPPSSTAPLTPPVAEPPPTPTSTSTVPLDPVTPDPIAADLHATDASHDPAEHLHHAHTHAPVEVGIGTGMGGLGLAQRSGGATALPEFPFEGSVRGQLQIDTSNIVDEGPGELDHGAIARVLQTRRPAFLSCYERELRNNPALVGTVRLQLAIAASGDVSSAQVVENNTSCDGLAACLARSARSLRFPPPDDGTVTLTIPLRFTASR